MKSFKFSIPFLIFIFHVLMFTSQAQEAQLPFHSPALSNNIDCYSFYPAMMLRHQIGSQFTKLPKNPVLQPSRGRWDSRDVADPFVLVTADSIMLFYAGDNDDRYHIGYAVQDKSGWSWVKRGKIFSGSAGTWDAYHQIAPVVFFQRNFWQLFYNGNDSDEETTFKWGYAEKIGTGSWRAPRKLPLVEIDTTAWDFTGNVYGDILYFPKMRKYKMWYTGFQGPLASIGLAESKDGIRWEKVGSGPVLTQFPGVISPAVIYNGENYRMYFVKLNVEGTRKITKIVSTDSPDGVRWSNFQDVLLPNSRWEKQQLMRPTLFYSDGRMYLYYCAGAGQWQIGAAYTKPQFEASGRWVSQPIQEPYQKLAIKYELSPQTSLSMNFIDPATEMTYLVYLEDHRQELRKNVYQSIVEIPQDLRGGNWQIELMLKTNDKSHSPVVFEMGLFIR